MSFSAIAQVALGIAYPLLVFLALSRFEPRTVALLVLALFALRAATQGSESILALVRALGFPMLAVAAVVAATIVWNDPLGLLLIPTFISVALLTTFGLSLRAEQSMIERFARLQVDTLSPQEIAYCRRVTLVWCVFFVVNGAVALGLALRESLGAWTLYTGLVSYLVIGALLASEYVYRHWRFRRYVGGLFDSTLERIFPPPAAAASPIPRFDRIDTSATSQDSLQFATDVPRDLACWPGHFDEHEIVPGVLLIDWLLACLQAGCAEPATDITDLDLQGIERLKFKHPVRPGDALRLALETTRSANGRTGPISFEYWRQDDLVASGRLVRRPSETPSPPAAAATHAGATASTHVARGETATERSGTPAQQWPPVDRLVPHGGAMRWVDRVLEHDAERSLCRVPARCVTPFLADPDAEQIGAWWTLEWMAQAVAAHDGLRRLDAQEAARTASGPRIGLLLGAKRARWHRPRLDRCADFDVEVVHLWGGTEGLAAFACRVLEADTGQLVAESQLSCFVPAPGELATLLA